MKLHVFFYLDCRPFSLLLAWNGDITGTDLSNCRSILAFSDAQQIRRLSDVFLGGHPWWHLRVAQPGAGLILPPAHFPAISGLWNTESKRGRRPKQRSPSSRGSSCPTIGMGDSNRKPTQQTKVVGFLQNFFSSAHFCLKQG